MVNMYSYYCDKCQKYFQQSVPFTEAELDGLIKCADCRNAAPTTVVVDANTPVTNAIPPGDIPAAEDVPVDPKQSQASKKITFDNVPITSLLVGTFGSDVGANKYGPYNWLELPDGTMSLMTYVNALIRHVLLYKAGQDYASESGVHHVDHMIAGLQVVRDAMVFGKVKDDRVKLSEEQQKTLEQWINKEVYK